MLRGTLGRRHKNAGSAGQETYRFTCYVMGTNTPFTVSTTGTEDVEELIRCIREKGELNRPVTDLIFWKVDIDLAPLGGVASRINTNNYENSMTILNNPTQLISRLWTGQPPAEHIHIIVEVPTRGGPSTSTGEIISRNELPLMCLVVKNDGAPLGGPFMLHEADNHFVADLAQRIKERPNISPRVLPNYIRLWKPNSPLPSQPSELPNAVDALHFNEPGREHDVAELNMALPLRHFFTPDQLSFGRIHVIAQLPSDGENKKGIFHLEPVYREPVPHESEITFTIPSKGGFASLKKSDISAEEVENATDEEVPPFLGKYRGDLARKRFVPEDSVFVGPLSHFLQRFGLSFQNYFQHETSSDEELVTDCEFGQYMHVLLSRNMLNLVRFKVGRESQFSTAFLHDLEGEVKRRQASLRACLTSWPFPLLAVSREGKPTMYRYSPMNDFQLAIDHFPHCLLEVVSGKKAGLESQADCWRMILQASCLARLGNKFRRDTNHPVVIMVIYIDSELYAREFLVYQPDISDKKVLYHETSFNLTTPKDAFEFIFRLYNLLSRVTADSGNLKGPVIALRNIAEEVAKRGLPIMTGKRKHGDHDDDDDDDAAPDQQRAVPGGSTHASLEDKSVQESLNKAGYELEPTDSMLVPLTPLKPTMRDATSSDGLHVMLKVVDDDTDELAILKHLNEFKSAANHTIELHGVVHTPIAKVIALQWGVPLDEYIRFHHPPESAALLPEQFLEGVAFLHEHRVAHLDLKPGNVVVDVDDLDREHRFPPRLSIIDFGVSMSVEDEQTTIVGYCGTQPWVAPEVGTPDGPDLAYSPILADRWACGHMVNFLEKAVAGGDAGSRGHISLKDQLTSSDPRARPPVKEVLDSYRLSTKGGAKRIMKVEE